MTIHLAIYAASTLVSMAIMSLGTAVVFLGILAVGIRSRFSMNSPSGEIRSALQLWTGYGKWSLWLALACFLSLAFARWHPIAGMDPAIVQWGKDLFKLWYFIWPPILALALFSIGEGGQAKVLKIWIAVFGVLSLVGIQQFWTGWPRLQEIPSLPGHFHATLFLGHHLSVASIWIFPFFIALSGVLSRAPDGLVDRLGLSKRVLLGIVIAAGLTLFLGFSRTLWAAMPVGMMILVFLRTPLSHRRRYMAWTATGVGAASVILFQVPMIRERLLHSIGTSDRFELWRANLELFRLRPMVGVGWHHNLELAGQLLRQWHGQSVFVGHAHNNFLEVLGGTGALGLIGWLGWNFWVARNLWIQSHEEFGLPRWFRELIQGAFAAFVVFHVNGLTQVNFWEGKVQHQVSWVLAWLLLGILRHELSRKRA